MGVKNAASGVAPEQMKAYAEVFRAAKKTMGQRGAAAIAENTDLTKSAPEYFKDFARAYNDGQKGERSDNPWSLSQEQCTAAFEAGRADAKAGDTDGTVVQVAKDAGVDWKDDYVKGTDQEVAKRIDQLGKDLGVRVRFVDVVRPVKGKNGIVGTADGQYEGNEILVEKNNPNPELFIAGHEFTHRMQDLSPETYNSFVQAVLADKAYFARGGTGTVEGAITAKIAQYKLKGEALTRETAIDELVADYAGHLLTNETYLDSFMESHKENQTMLEKLRDLFHEFSLTIKGALGNKAAIAEQKLTQMLGAETVYDCMQDKTLSAFVKNTLDEEIIPFVPSSEQFAADVQERFRNPYLDHQLTSIALNSISKWRARVLPSFKDNYTKNGVIPKWLTIGFSYLMALYARVEEGEGGYFAKLPTRTIQVLDDKPYLEYFAKGGSIEGFMSDANIWGEDLTAYEGLLAAVLTNVDKINAGECLL